MRLSHVYAILLIFNVPFGIGFHGRQSCAVVSLHLSWPTWSTLDYAGIPSITMETEHGCAAPPLFLAT